MSVLKIRENKDLIEQDPFEMFTADEPWSEKKTEKVKRKPFRKRPEILGLLLVVFAVIAVTSSVTVWSSKQSGADKTQMPYAYLELRVIDMDGRPVAGAVVSNNKSSIGVTDSFGEWRRFMRVALGGNLRLTVSKTMKGKFVRSIKNVTIPVSLPVAGDLEIKSSLQMGEPDHKFREVPISMSVADPSPKQVEKKEEFVASIPLKNLNRVWFHVEKPRNKAKSPKSRARAKQLATTVLNSLKKRARQLGLKVDPGASWKVKLQHLTTKPKGKSNVYGLIQITSFYEGKNQYSFLRNYMNQSLPTARGILYGLSKHGKKNYKLYKNEKRYLVSKPKSKIWNLAEGQKLLTADGQKYTILGLAANGDYMVKTPISNPCGKESKCLLQGQGIESRISKKGKKLLTMRVFGAAADTEVYVGGYRAVNLEGDVWQYQGNRNSVANVTAINDGKILYRGSVSARKGKRALLSIPGTMLSTRKISKSVN
jgi:hypothetical protein